MGLSQTVCRRKNSLKIPTDCVGKMNGSVEQLVLTTARASEMSVVQGEAAVLSCDMLVRGCKHTKYFTNTL
jgi:hypothetical protein